MRFSITNILLVPFNRHGFVECLEAEEWGGEEARSAKEGLLLLLLQLLPAAAPNFAHFLLGYQLHGDVRTTSLLFYASLFKNSNVVYERINI